MFKQAGSDEEILVGGESAVLEKRTDYAGPHYHGMSGMDDNEI